MEKLYFENEDSNNCHRLEDFIHDAKIEGLKEITLIEAIPENSSLFIWCTYDGEVTDRGQCKKSECSYYNSKSGRGVCSHRGNLYTYGGQVTFNIPLTE